MKEDSEFVERIVREVMRRLLAGGHTVAPRSNASETAVQQELNLPDRIVTLATLKGKLDGIGQVTVARRAVVTPSVRDELKQRKIELKRN